jgi:transcriptional regulator with XRE-family HTH domain
MDLRKKVKDKIELVGVKDAAEYFGVSLGTVSNWASGKTNPSIDAVELLLIDEPETGAKKSAELTMWEGRKLRVMLPVYRSFNPDTHYTLFANYAQYGPSKIAMEIKKRTIIYEARSMLTHKGMLSEADTFMMFDDDMILPCGNAGVFNGNYGANLPDNLASLNTISRLMSHPDDKGIVGALYFGRHRAGRAQCASGFASDDENGKLHRHEYTGLKPEEWVGTGGIRIKRWVIEEMDKAIEGGKWPEIKRRSDDRWNGYFTPRRVEEGEDVAFCRRAAEIGIQTYLDTDLELLHVGDENFSGRNTKY